MNPQPSTVWIAEVELSGSCMPRGVSRPQARNDGAARVLVRLHREVLGFVTLPLNGEELTAASVAAGVRDQLWEPFCRHMQADGLAPVAVPVDGMAGPCTGAVPRAAGIPELISVVVCTRNRPETLALCLKQLQEIRYGRFEVIVVDNAPDDEAARHCFLRLAGHDPRFRYVREPAPGLSRARNRGMSEAAARWVAFTDDDVQVDPWWLDAIAAGIHRDTDVGCVTGLVPPAELDHPAQQYFDERYAWAARMEPRVYDLDQRRDPSPLYPYSAGLFGTGANFAIDRNLLLDLGGFDENLGAGSAAGGGEDLEAFVRVLRAGRSLAYEPSAVVWHAHRAGWGELRRQLFSYGTGLTAFLTKCLRDRSSRREVVARLVPGVRRVIGLWSARGQDGRRPPRRWGAALRLRLVLSETAGMAVGAVVYLRQRRHSSSRHAS